MDALSEAGYRNMAAGRAAVPAWRYWTLFLLVAMGTFSMVDKMAIGTMLDDLTARERQVRQEGITAEVVELARATTARAVGDLRAAGLTSGGG